MSDRIPDLWPQDLNVNVLTPAAILRAQGKLLSKRTQGLVEGQVVLSPGGSRETYSFEIVAPVLGSRTRILQIEQPSTEWVYPVMVSISSDVLTRSDQDKIEHLSTARDILTEKGASDSLRFDLPDQDSFLNALRLCLGSPFVRSYIDSMIARSNEVKQPQNQV